jgi:hypothetical protein
MLVSNERGNWKLVNQAGEEVNKGDIVTSFRGEDHYLLGGSPPHKQGSSGHVSVKKIHKMKNGLGDCQYYPTVFDLEWVQLVKEQA